MWVLSWRACHFLLTLTKLFRKSLLIGNENLFLKNSDGLDYNINMELKSAYEKKKKLQLKKKLKIVLSVHESKLQRHLLILLIKI